MSFADDGDAARPSRSTLASELLAMLDGLGYMTVKGMGDEAQGSWGRGIISKTYSQAATDGSARSA